MNIINQSTSREIQYTVLGFSGGERHVQLEGISDAIVREVLIRARITKSDDILDLLLLENALRQKYGQALALNLELPYLPYARQDRVCAPGQAFSLDVFANLLRMLRVKRLVTWDCHSQTGIELTRATNVTPAEIILSDASLTKLLRSQNTVLVCPDKGAVSRCTQIKETLGVDQMVLCEKKRDPATGKIYKTEVLVDDLTDKCAVVTDDICDGGLTFIKIAEQLREKNVSKVVLFVTHGIFSKGLEVFDGLVDEIITTNSRAQTKHPKLRVINFTYDF